MNIFCGCELAFNNTYFTSNRRTFKVKTDAPIQSLTSIEVSPSAGSFSFPDDELGLQNRFILWRTDGSNLFLDEFSAKRDLIDSSITINFPQSIIIHGTSLFIYKGMLVLAVPTQSGIHSFWFQLIDTVDPSRRLTINKSIFTLLTSNEDLSLIHDFYALKNGGIASKVNITLSKQNGSLISALCLTDCQLLCVTLQQFQSFNQRIWEEVILHGNNVFSRLFKGKNADTCDVVIANNDNNILIYSVHRDGLIRCWNYEQKTLLYSKNLSSFLNNYAESNDASIAIKLSTFTKNNKNLLILKVFIDECTEFVLLEQSEKTLHQLFSCHLNTRYISDFICTTANNGDYCFWTIVNEPCYANENQNVVLQPYLLKRSIKLRNDKLDVVWEYVQSASMDNKMDSSLFNFPEVEAIRNRIFDGNTYSFSIVNRAVQVSCKHSQKQFEHNDWISLSNYVNDYLLSGLFKQTYLSAEDGSLILNYNAQNDAKLKTATVKFWQSLITCCNQFQEDELKPLGFFYSANLNLLGVIQVSRFTVYLSPDEDMRAICEPNNRAVKSFFGFIEQFLQVEADEVLSKINVDETLGTITTYADELCRIIRAFAEHRPSNVDCKIKSASSSFLASSFSTGYLAAALRRWIIGRLRFADIIFKLISTVPKILAISTEARTTPRLDLVISTYNSTIFQLIQYYTVMWIALSVRLINKSTDDRVSKQISVAQAFFKYGSSMLIKVLPNSCYESIKENQEDEDDFEKIIKEETYTAALVPSSWDKSSCYDTLNLSYVNSDQKNDDYNKNIYLNDVSFSNFFFETLRGSIISLWPESSTLTLPRFLAENGFYDALKSYCSLLSEPFIAELNFALRFLQGIAFSGLNDPNTAWSIFEDVSLGIISKDHSLNSLILNLYNPEPTEKVVTHSLVEYYNKVMIIFKSHGHSQYVIKAGGKAASKASKDDPVLANVFTSLFTQHLHNNNFVEAVRILLHNSNQKLQSACLRQLLAHLLDINDIKSVVCLNYEHLTEIVGNILETRCRNETFLNAIESNYETVFAFYIARFEFDKAARIMYDYAQRLAREIQSRELLKKRCKILTIVFQTMKLSDLGKEFVYCEVEKDDREIQFMKENLDLVAKNEEHANLFVGISDIGKENEFKKMKYVALSREDIGRELIKVEARLKLRDENPTAIPPLHSQDILTELIKYKKYDLAWVIACEFSLPLYNLLEVVTKDAIVTDQSQVFVSNDCEPLWTDINRQFMSGSIGSYKTHWRILISYIDLALRRSPSDCLVLRTVTYAFLKYSVKIPNWLFDRYKKVNFGDFIRCLIDFNDLADAYKYLLPEIDVAIKRVKTGNLDLLLPFTHIDELFRLSKNNEDLTPIVNETKENLKKLFNCYEIAMRGRQKIR